MNKILKKIFLPVIGLLSLVWFLVRVIPKPSRAAYPCMRAAAPLASTFVLYVIGFLSSIFFFKKANKFWQQSRYFVFGLALLLGSILALSTFLQPDRKAYALVDAPPDGPNQPMGTGVGIFPGRVVWIHNPNATDETCSNRRNDYWYMDSNTDQQAVNIMVSNALQQLTGINTDVAAWDALFRYHNKTHGKGDVGYGVGEKIVIKINLNSGTDGDSYDRWNYQNIDTSPQVVYAILDQLVNVVGVRQSDIGFGDPGRNVDNIYWDKFHDVFPDVEYWGEGNGRTKIERSSGYKMHTSDGTMSDWLPTCYVDAAYMINLPVLKKHHRGGISLSSKNHFGTFVPFRGSAFHWHFSLPASEGGGDVNNPEYGIYRCFVDIMGHKDIGGKTILYLVDGLWSSTNWAHPPIKWRMSPFNNDYPNSIFASQDPVAIESVGFDFLFKEFDENHPTEGAYDPSDNRGPFPHYEGVDDFLHQAADVKNRPTDIVYDPENDGTPLPESMGVHEHWNNAEEKMYSRNLGADIGIELISLYTTGVEQTTDEPVVVSHFDLLDNYPNPFNAGTTLEYRMAAPAMVTLSVYNAMGQRVYTLVHEFQQAGRYSRRWDGRLENGQAAPSGVYLYELVAKNDDDSFRRVKSMLLSK